MTAYSQQIPPPMSSALLKVPGASLYHERRGEGPLLLIIPGGPQDAGVFAGLAALLATHYTVVTFDPRGNSRSRFDGAPTPLDVDQQADDVAALIREAAAGPAYVFGTSGGAQIGFNLAARHPELVRVLVAHEPPAIMLLDDPAPAIAEDERLHQLYLDEGVDAAMSAFMGGNALDVPDESAADPGPEFEMSAEEVATFDRVSGNFAYWLAYGMRALSMYRPEIDTLRAGAPRIVVALGEGSQGAPISAMTLAAARALGVEAESYPGDHFGFEAHAEAFAERLRVTFR